MGKIDLTKTHKTYFTANTKPELVHIENAQFISICGKGDPNEKEFSDKIQVLYTMAYVLKFSYKSKDKDFVVSKLEGLWWFDQTKYANKAITTSSTEVPRGEWEYRLLIRLPEFVTKAEVEKAKEMDLTIKDIQLIGQIEFYTQTEGKSVQMLHVGPFSIEPEILKQIGKFMEANKLITN